MSQHSRIRVNSRISLPHVCRCNEQPIAHPHSSASPVQIAGLRVEHTTASREPEIPEPRRRRPQDERPADFRIGYIPHPSLLLRTPESYGETANQCTCSSGRREMSSEPPANGAAVEPNTPVAKQEAAPAVEYDDFGLPIRKPRPRVLPEEEKEVSSGDERFQSAAGTRRASREDGPEAGSEGAAKEVVNGLEAGKTEAKKEVPKEAEKSRGKEVEREPVESKDVAPIAAEPKADDQSAPPKETAAETKYTDEPPSEKPATDPTEKRKSTPKGHVSEYSHQALLNQPEKEEKKEEELEWQDMPAYARWDMYDDDNKLIAKENEEELEDIHGYANVGGAARGYTRVIMDDDADSVTSMDENTAYLFKEQSTALAEEDDEAARDPLSQMQTTKNLLTEGQRIAYVGLVRLAMKEMENKPSKLERTKGTKKVLDLTQETTKMWSQKIMVRLYQHMDIDASEQIMIEQLTEHGVVPADLTPALMQNARVKNPNAEEETTSSRTSMASPRPDSKSEKHKTPSSPDLDSPSTDSPPPPPYQEREGEDLPEVRTPSQLPQTKNIDIDLRWTILCDLFLVMIADSVYDARSRQLLENVGKYLAVDWVEICRFEKRVTDALEMQQEAEKENWNEEDHMQDRAKRARNKRIAFMGLATVGGSLVIGLSAGLLAPVIGAGLAMGFTTIGVAGTSGFLAGAGGAAIITTTGVLSGGTIGVRAANRRTGAVKTFEYRPLHNNKRVNLIVTVSGWMSGKVDDVRLPFSTVDPLMGDIYSVLWEPDMLRSMGDTINILATEVRPYTKLRELKVTDSFIGAYPRSPTSPRQHPPDSPHVRHPAPSRLDKAILPYRQPLERLPSPRRHGRSHSCRLPDFQEPGYPPHNPRRLLARCTRHPFLPEGTR